MFLNDCMECECNNPLSEFEGELIEFLVVLIENERPLVKCEYEWAFRIQALGT
jgi:hypothetical protein